MVATSYISKQETQHLQHTSMQENDILVCLLKVPLAQPH